MSREEEIEEVEFDLGMPHIRKWHAEAKVPQRATPGAAGFDVYADEDVLIPARSKGIVRAGFSLWMPKDHMLELRSRSGLSVKHDIEVGAGIIDSDFRGEVRVVLRNFGDKDYQVKRGDAIANGIFRSGVVTHVAYHLETEAFEESERGENGYGSTNGKVLEPPKFVRTKKRKCDEAKEEEIDAKKAKD